MNTTAAYANTTATFSTKTAAAILGVSAATVIKYIKNGKLQALRAPRFGWRVSALSLAAFLQDRNGNLALPLENHAFEGTVAPDLETMALRLSILTTPGGFRATIDPTTGAMTDLYLPELTEVMHHNHQIDLQRG